MIHYLLLLRPVTFQHEPPSYYHYHQRHPVPIPTKPRKPQQQKHHYQSICNSASTSTSSISSSTSHITRQATAPTTKTTVGERIQFCNCLHCITPSSNTNRIEAIQEQSANSNFRRGNNLPEACKSENQQEDKDRQEQNYPSVSIDRSCRWNSSSSSHHHSQQSKTVGASSASEQSPIAKERAAAARAPTFENGTEFTESLVGRQATERIKPVSNFESGKRFRPSPLPRFLSTLRKLHFPFTTTRIAVAPTSKKRKEGKEQGKLILEKHSPKETHSYSSFSSTTPIFSASSSSTSEPHQPKNAHVVAANKLEKTAITVKSASPTTATGSPSPSSALASPEEKDAVCGSRNVHTTPQGSQAEGSQKAKEGDGSSNSTISNCSNISNNNRKKSSKNFEKLKKFLLFCKGLRKKSK